MTSQDTLGTCSAQPTGTCTATLLPVNSSDPQVTWSCNAGHYVVGFDLAPQTTGSDNRTLATLTNVTCSDGQIISDVAGYPTPSNKLFRVRCVGSDGPNDIKGIEAMDDFYAGAINSLSITCADGTSVDFPDAPPGCDPACDPPFFAPGGTANGLQTCNHATHAITALSARNSYKQGANYTDATAIGITCSPLSDICIGDTLTDPRCVSYCTTYTGLCDQALRDYCSQPIHFTSSICGCALPASQYPLLTVPNQSGVVPPVACDQRCQNPAAIPLSNTGTCNVGVLCIQQGIDITAVQSSIGQGITLSQNCGNSSTGTSSSFLSFFTSTVGLIVIIAVVLLIIGIITVILITNANTKKKQAELKNQDLRNERSEQRREELLARGPTVLRVV